MLKQHLCTCTMLNVKNQSRCPYGKGKHWLVALIWILLMQYFSDLLTRLNRLGVFLTISASRIYGYMHNIAYGQHWDLKPVSGTVRRLVAVIRAKNSLRLVWFPDPLGNYTWNGFQVSRGTWLPAPSLVPRPDPDKMVIWPKTYN